MSGQLNVDKMRHGIRRFAVSRRTHSHLVVSEVLEAAALGGRRPIPGVDAVRVPGGHRDQAAGINMRLVHMLAPVRPKQLPLQDVGTVDARAAAASIPRFMGEVADALLPMQGLAGVLLPDDVGLEAGGAEDVMGGIQDDLWV